MVGITQMLNKTACAVGVLSKLGPSVMIVFQEWQGQAIIIPSSVRTD